MRAALGLTLVLALWLRLTGLGFGLPDIYHPDERQKLTVAANMVKTGDLNPHYFKKPSIVIYVNALVALGFATAAKATGRIERIADFSGPQMLLIGTGHTDFPGVVLLGRGLMALLGVFTVLLTYLIGRRYLEQEQAPLLAALGVALSPSEVYQSHFIETNVLVGVAILGVAWAALRVLERGAARDYAVAGFLVGIAASCKYTGATSGVFLVAAHLLRFAPNRLSGALWSRPFLVGLSLVPIGFVLGTPYALLEPRHFFASVAGEGGHYATGHAGQEGRALLWYLEHALTEEGPLVALGLAATIWVAVRRMPRPLLLASFPAVYFVFIAAFEVRNAQTFMPIVPFLHLLGASFLVELVRRALGLATPRRVTTLAALALLVLAGVAVPLRAALAGNAELTAVDARETAAAFIASELPRGTRIAIEGYSPWVSPERYAVKGFRWLWQVSPEELEQSGFQYVVFSSGSYGAMFAARDRYSREVTAYEEHWRRFPLVRRFEGAGTEIRIHAVRRKKRGRR